MPNQPLVLITTLFKDVQSIACPLLCQPILEWGHLHGFDALPAIFAIAWILNDVLDFLATLIILFLPLSPTDGILVCIYVFWAVHNSSAYCLFVPVGDAAQQSLIGLLL